MKKHCLILLVLTLLCLSVFSAAAYADGSLYRLEYTELRTTYSGSTHAQKMEAPYDTWYFLKDYTVYVTTGERYTYTQTTKSGKTLLTLNSGIFDNKRITVEGNSATAEVTSGDTTYTYVFRASQSGAAFKASIDSALQNGSALDFTWHAAGGNGGLVYRYNIYNSGKKLVESGSTTEGEHRFMPGNNDTYTLYLTAEDADRDVSECDIVSVSFVGDPNFVIVDGVVTSYRGTGTETTLPESLGIPDDKNKPVEKIGPRVFVNAGNLEKINLPDGITDIEANGFSGCQAKIFCDLNTKTAGTLSKMRLKFYDKASDTNGIFELMYMDIDNDPDTPDTLALTAYNGTEKNVTIPPEVKYIYNNAFKTNNTIESITIHNGVTGIGQNAFNGCSRLAAVNFDSASAELKTIGPGAFEGCGSLKTLTLPQNLISIGERAFANCEALERLVLWSNDIDSIGASAFYNCPADIYCQKLYGKTAMRVSELPRPIFWTNTVRNITLELRRVSDTWVLYSCSGSGTVPEIPTFVEIIAADAFKGNKLLNEVAIPASVTKIEANAFRGCTKLETVTFAAGSQLENIGDYAFNGCSLLKSVSLSESKNLPDKLLTIGTHAFSDCIKMDEIRLPDGVQAIGANAFFNGPKKVYCSSSDKEAGPADLVSAMPHTFWVENGSNAELELRWEQSNTRLVMYSYEGTPNAVVPNNVEEIKPDAFRDVKNSLQSVRIPQAVTVIPTGLFDGFGALQSIVIADGTLLEAGAIRKCAELTRVDGLSDLSVIDSNFDNCPKLMLNIMPYKGIKLSLDLAFAGKTKLSFTNAAPANLKIQYTNGKIAQYENGVVTAYKNGSTRMYLYADGKVGSCDVTVVSALTGLKLPEGIEELDKEAFMNDSSVKYVQLPETLNSIGDAAFANDSALLFVNIPGHDADVVFGKDVFSGCNSLTVFLSEDNITAQSYCTQNGVNFQFIA